MSIVQIAPIKLNPWSTIARSIGNSLNRSISEQVENLSKEVNSVKADIEDLKEGREKDNAIICRNRILRFDDELRNNKKHTLEAFKNVMTDIKDYNTYCSSHKNFKNEITISAERHIEEVYENCWHNNSFL